MFINLGTENMIVRKCSLGPSHPVVRRMFMKKFGMRGRRTKIFAEKLFSEVHTNFLKFGTVTDHRSKKVSSTVEF